MIKFRKLLPKENEFTVTVFIRKSSHQFSKKLSFEKIALQLQKKIHVATYKTVTFIKNYKMFILF